MPLEVAPLPGYHLLGQTPDGTAVVQAHPRLRVLDLACECSCEYLPEDILAQYPFLSLSEIQQAIAYYLEHRDEIDAEIERLKSEWQALARDRQQASRLEVLRREIALGVQELDERKGAPLDIAEVKSSARAKR